MLPHVADIRLGGLSPLAAVPEFVNCRCPRCRGAARRETDVSDNFLDSAWYFLRYVSPDRTDQPWDPRRVRRWLPVDFYAGGPEHTTMHHLYARFITMALHDLGLLPFAEPFRRLRLHGLITNEGAKMSKSRGNVVRPDDCIDTYGTDATRLGMLFLGPWEDGGQLPAEGLRGTQRFVNRVWSTLCQSQPEAAPEPAMADEAARRRRELVARVTEAIEGLRFNVAIAALMEEVAWLRQAGALLDPESWCGHALTFAKLLAPLAPHLAEEVWQRAGGSGSVHTQSWPHAERAAETGAVATVVVQVDGRVRDRVTVPIAAGEAAQRAAALASPRVQAALNGAAVARVVVVPGRVVSLVTEGAEAPAAR
jgi:leucyl-tRNA synthetase